MEVPICLMLTVPYWHLSLLSEGHQSDFLEVTALAYGTGVYQPEVSTEHLLYGVHLVRTIFEVHPVLVKLQGGEAVAASEAYHQKRAEGLEQDRDEGDSAAYETAYHEADYELYTNETIASKLMSDVQRLTSAMSHKQSGRETGQAKGYLDFEQSQHINCPCNPSQTNTPHYATGGTRDAARPN